MISDYLLELRQALRLPTRRRGRILVEVEDHLICAAAELHADGVAADEAERQALARFGSAQQLAGALIDQEATIEGTRTARSSGLLAVLLALVLVGPLGRLVPWGRYDFPWSIAGFVLAQVALVAGALSVARALCAAPIGGPSGHRLRFLLRGGAVVVGCGTLIVTGAALLGAFADTGWTPLDWGALALVMLLVIATGVELVRSARVAAAATPTSSDSATPADALADLQAFVLLAVAKLGQRIPALRRPLTASVNAADAWARSIRDYAPRISAWLDLRGHPKRFALSVSLGAGVVLAAGHAVLEPGLPRHVLNALLGAVVIIAVEATASIAGFALLGRFLGIRIDPE